MARTTVFRAVRLAMLSAAAVMSACGHHASTATSGSSTVAVQPVATGGEADARAAAWRNPVAFAADTRRRMNEITEQAERDIAVGELSPHAAPALDRHRQYIERLLSVYGADGVIQRAERDQVRDEVERLREVPARFEREQTQRARGGGPGGWR